MRQLIVISILVGFVPLDLVAANKDRSVIPHRIRNALKSVTYSSTEPSYNKQLARALLIAPEMVRTMRHSRRCPCPSGSVSVYPLSFSLPIQYFRHVAPVKTKTFSAVIPDIANTYIFKPNTSDTPHEVVVKERNYYGDMADSLFSITFKKAGWDCLRHLEIIASGALPIFTDIQLLPQGTMAAHPTTVYRLLKEWPGLVLEGFPGVKSGIGGQTHDHYFTGEVKYNLTQEVDKGMYQLAVEALLHIGRSTLSTHQMAKYMLRKVGIDPKTSKILFVASVNPDSDYLAETLLHGLQSVMTHPVVDYPRRSWLYRDKTVFTEGELAATMTKVYGFGFGYAHSIYEPPNINRTNIHEKVVGGEYDFIIFGISHRSDWVGMLEVVCSSTPEDKVVFVHGDDHPPTCDQLTAFSKCSKNIFVREMPAFCS